MSPPERDGQFAGGICVDEQLSEFGPEKGAGRTPRLLLAPPRRYLPGRSTEPWSVPEAAACGASSGTRSCCSLRFLFTPWPVC